MNDPQGGPSPDDTAAFQRFYAGGPAEDTPNQRGLLYRIFVGWWRDRT